jgi:predicted porin
MKFKTSAIALAVAGIVAAPVAVQAGADEVYASARVGLQNTDTGGAADFNLQNMSSRFGMRGETDLGNGITSFGRFEWSVGDGAIGLRHRYVGLKGDFGSVLLGQTNHTFFKHVVGPLDNPWWYSGTNMLDYRSRDDNGLTYAGSAGAVNFGATAFFVADGEETTPDALEFGASFGVGDMTIGVALATVDEDGGIGTQGGAGATDGTEDIIAFTVSGIALGDATFGVGMQIQDDDSGLVADLGIGNIYVHIEQLSLDAADTDSMQITVGYTQSLGRKTSVWYEFATLDADTDDDDDDVTFFGATLKYDII